MAVFAVVVISAMVVSSGAPAMSLAMAVVGAPLERMVSSIVVIVAVTALVSMVVVSVVLPVTDAPDCSGVVAVEMVVLLDGLCCFFGCFDFIIVSTLEAQLWWLQLLLFVLFFLVVADDVVVCGEKHLFLRIIVMYVLVISLFTYIGINTLSDILKLN